MSTISRIEQIVWYEMVHAAYWEQYVSQYISHKHDKRVIYNTIILILSTVGASSFSLWELVPKGKQWVPVVLFGIMAITQLVSVCKKNVVIDDDTLCKLRKLRVMYLGYLNKIERLYIDIKDKNLDNEEIKDRYYSIRETVYPIEDLKDSLNIKKLKKPNEKGQYEMEVRLSRKFDTPINPRKSHNRISSMLSISIRKAKKQV